MKRGLIAATILFAGAVTAAVYVQRDSGIALQEASSQLPRKLDNTELAKEQPVFIQNANYEARGELWIAVVSGRQSDEHPVEIYLVPLRVLGVEQQTSEQKEPLLLCLKPDQAPNHGKQEVQCVKMVRKTLTVES
jgi:hypothetical protein